MDMDEIRTFVAIARTRGFSRAAATLHRSQPAISRRIDLLERELDAPLFERIRGGVILTEAGAALLPYAETVLAAAREGTEAVRALRQANAGRISLALVGTLANASLTRLLRQFRGSYPNVRLDLQTATSQQVGELVLRGEATLGLRYLADPRAGLVCETVAEEALVVVGCGDHRLADGRKHRPRELAGERWVAFPMRASRESFVQFLERKLLAAGLDDPEIIPIDSLTAQKRLVEAGFGIALLARSTVEEELRLETLRVLDVPLLRARIPVTIVYRRNGYLSTGARSLMSTIAAAGSQIGTGPDANRRPHRRVSKGV
jgi:DNA-binding transcriptional LysR family regulator